MRILASLVIGTVLTACGAGPEPTDPQTTDPPPDAEPSVHELTLPAEHASSYDVVVYAEVDGGQAAELTELSYGLADSYPRQVTIAAERGFVTSRECLLRPGTVVWRSIVDVQGTAAKLDLDAGVLAVELREEGTVSVLLEGEITEQQCSLEEGGPIVTSVPLRHRVELHVHRIAGFEVEQYHQRLADCWSSVVLPSGAPLWAPTALPFDAAGQTFAPVNAPAPVSITLRSAGALTSGPGDGQLSAGPGDVSVSVDTSLPVRGLRSFKVVGPDALTSVQAALYLRKAASKGSVSEPIEEGGSYRLFFPELSNGVDVQVDSAMTADGKLCDSVPGAWFAATSSTPEQCDASAEDAEAVASSIVPVAAIGSVGECRLSVTIPGTTHGWTTRFSTTL